MATKFYLHNATSTVGGTLPASNASVSATTPSQIGDSGTNRSANLAVGTANPDTEISITTAANTNAQPSLIARFVSAPIAAQTIGAQSMNISIGGTESNASSNFQIRYVVAIWRPSTGALVGRMTDLATNATAEPGTSETSLTATLAANSTSQTSQDQDVIVFEVWRDSTVQAMSTAYTNTIAFDGTTEASITTNAAFINFATTTVVFAPQSYGQAQADIKVTTRQFAQAQGTTLHIGVGQAQARVTAFVNSHKGSSSGADVILTLTQLQAQDIIIVSHLFLSGGSASHTASELILISSAPGVIGTTNTIQGYIYEVKSGVSSTQITLHTSAGSNTAHAVVFRAGGGQVYNYPDLKNQVTTTGTNPVIGSITYVKGQMLYYAAVGEETATAASNGSSYILINQTTNGAKSLADEYSDFVTSSLTGAFINANNVEYEGMHIALIKATQFRVSAQAQAQIIATPKKSAQALAQIDTGVYSATDTYTRTVGAGSWGTADVGGSWTIPTAPSEFSVDGSKGISAYSGISTVQRYALLKGVTTKRLTRFKVDVTVHSVAGLNTIDNVFIHHTTNGVGDAEYGVNLTFNQSTLAYTVQANILGAGTTILSGTLVLDTVYTIISEVILPSNITDDNARARVKFYSGTEPAGWQIDDIISFTPNFTNTSKASPAIEVSVDHAATFYFDNLSFQPIGWTQYGQAQAKITTTRVYAQANARINSFVTSGTVSGTTTQTITLNGLRENDRVIIWVYFPNTLTVTVGATNMDGGGLQGWQKTGATNTLKESSSLRGLSSGFTSTDITINVTGGTGSFVAQAAAFRAGLGLVYLNDNIAVTNTATGTSPSIGSPTITSGQIPQDLVVGALGKNTNIASSAGNNFTIFVGSYSDGTNIINIEYYDFATSSIAVNWSDGSNVEWEGIADSFIKARVTTQSAQAMAVISRYDYILSKISGLQSYWKLNDPAGSTTIKDFIGGITGTVNGSPTFLQTPADTIFYQLGAGIKFNSSSDFLTFGDNYDFPNATDTFTIILWFKSTGVLGTSRILSKESSNGVGWQLVGNSTYIELLRNGTAQGDVNTSIGADTWYFFAVTANGSTTRGLLTDIFDVADPQGASTNTTNLLTVANNAYNTSSPFAGTISNIAIYNTGLSLDDLQALSTIGRSGAIVRPAQAQAFITKSKGLGQAAALINGSFPIPITDTFTRTVSNGVGTSDTGGTWSGDTTFFNVDGSKLTIVFNAGTANIQLPNVLTVVNLESLATVSFSALPDTGLSHSVQLISNLPSSLNPSNYTNYNNTTGNEFVILDTGVSSPGAEIGASSSLGSSGTYTAGDFWYIKGRVLVTSTSTKTFAKAWKVGTSEPDWQITKQTSVIANPGHVGFSFLSGSTALTITVDDYNVYPAFPVASAQAQAKIKQTYNQFSQAQADIKAVGRGFAQAQGYIPTNSATVYAQAQADILVTSRGYAQSQADILQTYRGYSQVQADILQTYRGYSQAQADIKATSNAFAQSQADIKATTNVFAQSQADIKATSNAFAQSQADIKQTYNAFAQAQACVVAWRFAQAQADIKQTYQAYAQSQVDIKATTNAFAQANADIKTTTNVFAQSQADIKVTSNTFAQSQADILKVTFGFSQAQADIKATSNVFAQSQADIKQTSRGYAQGQADIKQTYNAFAQAQGDIKATSNSFAQAQADILKTYQVYAQSQADIKQTYNAFANAQADIKATYNAFAQSQADIKATSNAFAQAQADIKQTYRGYAQANADILVTYQVYAQAQARIDQVYNAFAQSQADIKAVSNAFAQAQAKMNAFGVNAFAQALANIKGIDIEGVGQAQAKINAFGVQGYAQAQSDISATYRGYAQAQADVKATTNKFAQAQADILETYFGFAQSQADIKQVYNAFAQSQADIKQTYQSYAQAQADIKQIYNAFAQANADIKQIYQDYAQAQADILKTYQAYAQAQARILATYLAYAQAQADIKQTYNGFGQANANILQTYKVFAQTQADILQVYRGYAQAQADILQVYFGFAQAQARILTSYQAYAQAQADIKQTYNSFAQVQADILTSYQVYAQAQADILRTFNGYAQAQASILSTYNGYAQAQADIKAVGYGFGQAQAQMLAFGVNQSGNAQGNIAGKSYPSGQAQAKINAFGIQGYGQAQADILAANNGYGQSQGTILQKYNGYGQSQADILVTYNGFGQSQADIKQTYQGYANAQADIVTSYQGYGQAQAQIKHTYNTFAQANADINTTYQGYGQAQADITTTYFGFAQAQAWIETTTNNFGQTQGSIKQTYQGYANTQADIKQIYFEFAQAQGTILQTYRGYAQAQTCIRGNAFGQAQGYILVGRFGHANAQALIAAATHNTFGQSQGTILATSNVSGQVNADILVTTDKFSQSQSDIKQTYQGYANAQGYIKRTERGFGQAQGAILATYRAFGQSQADILATTNKFGQAQGDIKQTYQGYAQTQAWIEVTSIVFAQANGAILKTYIVTAQAQGLILTFNIKCANAQALIVTTVIVNAQAQALIASNYGFAQAIGLISVSHILKRLVSSDRVSLRSTLRDRLIPTVRTTDHSLTLGSSDSSLNVDSTDRALRIEPSDRTF